MPIKLYGINNCDTIRKAKRWLDDHGIAFTFHDFRKDGLTCEQLNHWENTLGWESLLNKRGTTWRKLSDEKKSEINRNSAIDLMLEHPAMIKRPILDTGKHLIHGFNESDYQTHLT